MKQIFKPLLQNKLYSREMINIINKGYDNKISYKELKSLSRNHSDLEILLYLHDRYKRSPKFRRFKRDKIKSNKRRAKRMSSLIKRFFKVDGSKILDVGTEDCYYIETLRENGAKAVGLNIETDIYSGYSHISKMCIHKYDGVNIPEIFEGGYDIVTCFMTIHHMEDKRQTLKNVFDRLVTGGHLVIREHDVNEDMFGGNAQRFVDFIHFFYELIENEDFNYRYYSSYDEYYITKDNLTKMLEEIGFKEVNILPEKLREPKGLMRVYYNSFQK